MISYNDRDIPLVLHFPVCPGKCQGTIRIVHQWDDYITDMINSD